MEEGLVSYWEKKVIIYAERKPWRHRLLLHIWWQLVTCCSYQLLLEKPPDCKTMMVVLLNFLLCSTCFVSLWTLDITQYTRHLILILCLGIFQPEHFQNSVPWIAHSSGPCSHWVMCNTEHSIGAQLTNSKSLETPICQTKMYPCSIKESVPLLLFAALSDLYIQLMMSHSVWWVWCVFSVGWYDHKCY